MWGYVAAAAVLVLLFSRLSTGVEAETASTPRRGLWIGIHRSRRVVARLAVLFGLDSFAGGFIVQGLMAYWLHLRYGVEAKTLGAIFFGTSFLSAVSFLFAAPIARRIGLLNTMVFTHLVSNVLLLVVPFMPTVESAVGFLLARHLLSQLDVPTRQSYTMAIVDADERSAMAGITSVSRNIAASFGPAIAGATLSQPALGLPFLAAGGLKIVYDLLVFALFRKVRPPEESRTGEE
jgi:sugar phosphate permease